MVFHKKQKPILEARGKESIKDKKSSDLIEIFKSPDSLKNFLADKEDKKVVLKMNMKKR